MTALPSREVLPASATPSFKLPLSGLQQSILGLYWFAQALLWGAILSIILPSQVEKLLGNKETNLPIVTALGVVVATIAHPLFGAISDYTRARWGRRRPWLVLGSLIMVVGLMGLAFAPTGSVVVTVLFFAVLQFGSNVAGAPWSAILNDTAPPEQFGVVSGWRGLWSIFGTVVGAVLAGQLLDKTKSEDVYRGQLVLLYGIIAVVLLGSVFLSVLLVPEKRYTGTARFSLASVVQGYRVDTHLYRDFWWFFLTKFLYTLGVWSIFTFLQYYFDDVLKLKGESEVGTFFLPGVMLTALVSTYFAGRLSDRYGRKRMVFLSGLLMFITSAGFVFIRPTTNPVFFSISDVDVTLARLLPIMFGLGYGIYYSVDWALICDVLPNAQEYGRDVGMTELAGIAPQAIGVVFGGIILTTLRGSGDTGYAILFGLTAGYFLLSSLFVRKIKGST